MKRTFNFFTAVLAVLAFTNFITDDLQAQETRDLKSFDGIGIAINADVYYTQGNTHQITIEGDADDVRDLITEVKDGFLKLRYDDWKVKRSKITVHVTSSELEKISVSGSGKFNTEKLTSDELEIAISGSGNINIASLDGDEVEVRISGSGSATLEKGSADEMGVKISGSGKLMAELFEVSEFDASISGSGNVKITVTDELEARLSGSGSVYYHGNPQVNTASSGSGKVRSL
jgi:hypothetical protein